MAERDSKAEIPRVQKCVAVFWPPFLTAGIATILFFAVFDPKEMLACAGLPGLSRIGAYSIGFFFFWVVSSGSCALALYFAKPCPSLRNREDHSGPAA